MARRSIWEKIKGFKLIDSIIKYEKNVDKEVKVKMRDLTIIALQLDEKSLPYVKELLGSDAGLVREDLVLPQGMMLTHSEAQRTMLKAFKGFIEDDHYRALILAYATISFEDINDDITARMLKERLIGTFGEDGKHVYNMARSRFIEEWFYYELVFLRFSAVDEKYAQKRFKKYFSDCLEYYEMAIWVNEFTLVEDIKGQLWERFHKHLTKRVFVFARGDLNLAKIRMAVSDFVEDNTFEYSTEEEEYKIATSLCCSIEVVLKKKPELPRKKKKKKK